MGSQPLVSFIVATYNRREDLKECIQSIIDQEYKNKEIIVISDSDNSEADLFTNRGHFDDNNIKYIHNTKRQGVPGARNAGFKLASGQIYITLDDDAVLASTDVTPTVVSKFTEDPELGAIAFQSIQTSSGKVQSYEFPHRSNSMPKDNEFETTYFIGVANALRAEALEVAGLYPEEFEYGFEELDISFRIIDEGYKIYYLPAAKVYHKEAPEGRYPDNIIVKKRIENRIRVSLRNLPWRAVIVSTLVWVAYGFWMAKGDPRPIIEAFKAIKSDKVKLVKERDVIDTNSFNYIKSLDGRLYW